MSLFESLLDRSVVFSFDRNGFRRHERRFRPEDLDVDLTGRTCLVTGGSSGIGQATAAALAEMGAEVRLLCRNRERGQRAVDAIGRRHVSVEEVDVASLASIRAFAKRLRKSGQFFFDRETKDTVVLPGTREAPGERERLWEALLSWSGLAPS